MIVIIILLLIYPLIKHGIYILNRASTQNQGKETPDPVVV